MYRQKAVCEREGVPFRSKIALMEERIRTFEPVPGTLTHVLLDAWYSAKAIWQAARQRGFLITSGLRSNRWLRVADATAPQGWRWQRLADYVASLRPEDYQAVTWPRQTDERTVYAHVVSTPVRKLYRLDAVCPRQVVVLRTALDAPLSEARCWALQ